MCFNGEIRLNNDLKIGGFKAGGLIVKVRAPTLAPSFSRLRIGNSHPPLNPFAGLHRAHNDSARAGQGAVQGDAFGYPYSFDYGPVVSQQHDERRRGRLVCSPDPARSGLRLLAAWRRCTIIEPEEGDERSRPECQPKTIANNLNTRTSLYRSPPLVML